MTKRCSNKQITTWVHAGCAGITFTDAKCKIQDVSPTYTSSHLITAWKHFVLTPVKFIKPLQVFGTKAQTPDTSKMASNGHNKMWFCLEYSGLSENPQNTFKTFIAGATPIQTCDLCFFCTLCSCMQFRKVHNQQIIVDNEHDYWGLLFSTYGPHFEALRIFLKHNSQKLFRNEPKRNFLG